MTEEFMVDVSIVGSDIHTLKNRRLKFDGSSLHILGPKAAETRIFSCEKILYKRMKMTKEGKMLTIPLVEENGKRDV